VVLRRHRRTGRPLGPHRTVVLLPLFTTANADSQGNTIDGSTLCDGVPATWEGQAQQFTAVQDTARAAGAIGVFYWEPTWTAIKGNGWDPADMWGTGDGWDNMALFDWHGRLNPNIRWKP